MTKYYKSVPSNWTGKNDEIMLTFVFPMKHSVEVSHYLNENNNENNTDISLYQIYLPKLHEIFLKYFKSINFKKWYPFTKLFASMWH